MLSRRQQMSEDRAEFALDRQSNIRLFERLANPHMLDDRRLEELKLLTMDAEMPFRMPRGIVIDRESPVPTEIDEDERQSQRTSPRNSRSPRESPRDSRSPQESPRESPRKSPRESPRESPRNSGSPRESSRNSAKVYEEDDNDFCVPKSVTPRSSARSSSSNRIDRKHHRFQFRDDDDLLLPKARTQPPPLPSQQHESELDRLRARIQQPGPSLMQMREQHQQRQQHKRGTTPPQYAPSGYDAMFRKICQERKRGVISSSGGGGNNGGEYRPMHDPDYAEKRELLIKLDELRTLGFNVPKMDAAMPLEDLQTEITRRTVSMGTVETVETVVGWMCSAATVLETVNNMAGPFLPMENYAKSVREGTQTPRFKYAMYQLVLRYQGRHAGNPWRVVLIVLLAPLIQGALIKLIQWVMKGRLNVSSGMIGSGLKTLFSFGKKKDDANSGVPAGIPGISPENKPPTVAAPSGGGGGGGNPFASFFKSAAKAAAAPVASTLPPTSTATPAEGPVTRPKRPRLQRPNEIAESSSEVGVATADQI
jgi:hypothetical protein